MNGEVHLIVGANAQELQLNGIGLISGAALTNPCPIGYFNSDITLWTIASQILLVTTDNPETWTVLATLNVVSIDTIAQTFDFTTGDFIDPDIIYNFAFYTNASVSSQAYVDLYPLESISQNFIFQDAGNFAPLGDFTREFRVPASDRNLEIFGLLDSFTFSDTANVFGTKIPAEIRVDTLPIMRGHVRVIRTFKRNDQLADIQLSFYGEAPDLFRSIGDKLLADIQYLTALDTVVDFANVTSPAMPNDLIFGLTDKGQKWDNTGAGRPINNSEQPLYAADLTPFICAWTLFSKIINEAGFTLGPTPLETILSGYWCPWVNAANIVTQETVSTYYFSAGYTTNTSLTDDNFFNFPELVDNAGQYTGGYFQAPNAGFYAFRFWANVIPVGSFGANTGGVKFYKYTGAPLSGTIVVNYEVAISGYDQNNGILQRILITTDPIYLLAGEKISPYTEFNGTPIFQGSATNDPLTGTGWELFSYRANYGDTLNTAANSPNIKQVDFVRDILAMHGAAVIPSRTVPNEVTIIPLVDYLSTGDDLNWTQKLDITKDITLSPTTDIQKRNFLWSYKNGGDFFSKIFTDNGRTYGQYKILDGYSVASGAPVNEFVTGDLTTKLTAESTPCVYVNGTTIPIPKFINDKGEFVAPNLRFLFLADVASLPLFDDGAAAVDLGVVNVFNHYSSINASVGDYDLNFAPETPLHAITTNPFRNLFNEYWRDYLNGLYSPEARILEAYFALDLSDILSFRYNDRVFIKDSYWRIVEITDYKVGLFESTKVKLLKIVEPAPDCDLVPTTVLINDDMTQVIEFEDLEGNPAPSNSACCIRYGYQWEPMLGQCIAYGTPIITDPGGGSSSMAALMLNSGVDGMPSNVLARTANTSISVGNTFGVYAGERISIESGNQNTLAVGERLKLEGANRGSTLLGRNAYSNIMGLHYGGGDRVSAKEGNQQSGVIILANSRTFTAAAQTLELATGTDVLTRINLPNDTSITSLYILQASDLNGNAFYQTGSLYIEKIGGLSVASTPIPLSNDTSGAFTFTLAIDTATNTAEHRFIVTNAGTGWPLLVNVVLTLHYNQTR